MAFVYDHDKLWFSHLHPPISGAEETWFYDEPLPFAPLVEESFSAIRSEIFAALSSGKASYDAVINNQLVVERNRWQSFSFIFWDTIVSETNCALCPFTLSVLRQVEGLVSASVSILEPHTHIQPHRGDTNAIYRCHLPLKVPAPLPKTGIYVGYAQRSWEEGRLLVFNDAAYHKAWNESDEARLVLIFDVIRPQFMAEKEEVCKVIRNKFVAK